MKKRSNGVWDMPEWEGTSRPEVYGNVDPYAWQSKATGVLAGIGGLRAAAKGTSIMGGAFGPAPMALMFANPKARLQQIRADTRYLQNAREVDAAHGLPSIRKSSMKSSESYRRLVSKVSGSDHSRSVPSSAYGTEKASNAFSNLVEKLRSAQLPDTAALRGKLKKALFPPTKIEVVRPGKTVFKPEMRVVDPGGTFETQRTVRSFNHKGDPRMVERRIYKGKDPAGNPIWEDVIVPDMSHQVVQEVRPRKEQIAYIREESESVKEQREPLQLGRALFTLPMAVAGVGGILAAHRGMSRAHNRLLEGRRFRSAMNGLNIEEYGDPMLQEMWEEDPEQVSGEFRRAFKMLNKYAPSIAKDENLSREYMRRLTLDPHSRLPPEQYLREVQRMVELENAIRRTGPALLDGISAVPLS